jgi:hypothetical protein
MLGYAHLNMVRRSCHMQEEKKRMRKYYELTYMFPVHLDRDT